MCIIHLYLQVKGEDHMSLTLAQEEATRHELAANLAKTHLTQAAVAQALDTTPKRIAEIMAFNPRRLEDPWIVRNYLLEQLQAQGVTPEPFTALVGDYHKYWFLDGNYIDRARIA